MLVLFSQLKKYLPDLNVTAREAAQVFTMTGQMLDKFWEVEYNGQKDSLMDLEVRQNRADCFGVMGLTRELSAYYNIPMVVKDYQLPILNTQYSLPLQVQATSAVKRLMAVKIENITIQQSPAWLQDYLKHYNINPINNLVDLTNYVMIETGHPSHAFDRDLVGTDALMWEINPNYKTMKSLDGTEIKLVEEALAITDGTKPLALAGIVGGMETAINSNTKTTIVEMAVYEGGLIRRNSRQMREMTEASLRLEKYLDPDSLPEAFHMLISLILEHCGGTLVSDVYDNYLRPTPKVEISLNIEKVSQLAGINISKEDIIDILSKLGFGITDNGESLRVVRPVNRLDVDLEEDVVEEVIRMHGYDKIPRDELSQNVVKEITPSILKLIESTGNLLVNNGFDEVRSWILVDQKANNDANFGNWEVIQVTNSINEEVPYLRQSIAVSLIGQLENYTKNNIQDIQLFEIGKVFGKMGTEYKENYQLGLLIKGNDINLLKSHVEKVLRSKGLGNISYEEAAKVPNTAHPKTAWYIKVAGEAVGIIYLTNDLVVENQAVIAEINLDLFDSITSKFVSKPAQEIEQKVVVLDTNISLNQNDDLRNYITNKLESKAANVWKWEVIDQYNPEGSDQVKYTVRVNYSKLSDQEAKAVHGEMFGG